MADAAYSIVVICEAAADQRTACGITDRVPCQSVDWIQPEILDSLREWRGLTKGESFLTWKSVHARADAANIRINGHFGGEPGAPDAFVARRALALLMTQGERNIDAVLLLRDSDMDLRRRKGLEQARAHTSGLGPIIKTGERRRASRTSCERSVSGSCRSGPDVRRPPTSLVAIRDTVTFLGQHLSR